MEITKPDIRKMSEDELIYSFLERGEKTFRGRQVYEWLWKKGSTSFEEMTNLSKETRKFLSENFSIPRLSIHSKQTSNDNTVKFAFKTHDGHLTESVLIPSGSRATVCVSSQIGCKLNCTFCATGKIPFKRNLTQAEIFDQIMTVKNKANEMYNLSLSNIVYMGMGEPLLNYEEVKASIELIGSEKSIGFSPRRITLSTIGLPEKIKQLADDQIRFNLAVSLHSALDETRTRLIPVNKKYNLEAIRKALQHFNQNTGKRITFEYLMLKDINDTLTEARALAEYCKNFPVKINLIEYNATGDPDFQKPNPQKLNDFKTFLESKNLVVNLRKSRGEDIDAACGQLSGKKAGKR
ncbi:MAG: 23S rRNA (adenine(2503)-C(2))-methyltransferase RlmN [Bacteroidales bacterium]